MSRIYFHTRSRTAEVRGSERAYINRLSADMTRIALRLSGVDDDRAWLRSVIVDAGYDVLARDEWWMRDFETWMSVGWDGGGLLIAGEKIGASELAANTLIATGSPILTLMAKIEGTCEDHAWMEGEHAGWAREIIRDGRESNLLRPQQGWEDVIGLLGDVDEGRVDGPVVLSYSVCEGFPNSGIAGDFWKPPSLPPQPPEVLVDPVTHVVTPVPVDPLDAYRIELDYDAWYELPDDERWCLAEAGMRARQHTRQISPELVAIGFQTGASAFDLAAERWEDHNRRQEAEAQARRQRRGPRT